MPPVLSIVGISNSGKTTLIEKLVGELKSRGYRLATVKHAAHGTSFDDVAKDSGRHLEAGSQATVLVSQDRMFLIEKVCPDAALEKIVERLGEDHDIILAEGFKRGLAPKIEVHRKEAGPLLEDLENLIAIATDEPLETDVRQFSLEDVKGLADFIEEGFIEPQSERLSLYINDQSVSLKDFPTGIITNVLIGIAASLRGVGKVGTLKFFLRKRD
ncbi:MAG: molybdopterin-guanine dinucleotide biosynthesis protein B [Dehalococcoidales bacterium]|nr:molybdopterin-guanine dinucleotide biosynthesis protein B [Dehalococcoidales bacterium]